MNIIRASELGSCLKAQVAKHLGYTPMDAPEKMQVAFERGNEHETLNAGAMIASGWEIAREQEEITLDVLDGWQVIGHVDGHTRNLNDAVPLWRVWEAKAPGAYDKFETAYKNNDWSDTLAHRYAWQISCYMLATGLEAYVTSWDEERGVRGFGIEIPPFTLEQVKDRVWLIAEQMARGTPPQECSQADWPCPFYYLHEDAEELTDDPELDVLVGDYLNLGGSIKRQQELQKDIQTDIRERLAGKNVVTAVSKVTFYTQAAATRYDMDAIAKALKSGVSLEDFRIAGKSSERMKITRRGDSESP